MTGRELIIYIMENHLEDRPVFEDGKFIGFNTVEEVATKYGVGSATVNSWIILGLLEGVKVDNSVYIPDTPKAYADVVLFHQKCK